MADDAPSSPKRKKVRAKYASSVSCRRSKLKCSGQNPCQRCLDNGKRCFYSEDQTAAEALQNLSRPTPVQSNAAPSASGTNGTGNVSGSGNGTTSGTGTTTAHGINNGLPRRNLLPRESAMISRRASDASALGLSMEARMARIESMMESLMHERAMASSPRTSMERDAVVGDRLQADFLMQIAGEASMSSFAPIAPTEFRLESPDRIRHSISAVSRASSADAAAATIRVGNRSFAFPGPAEYQNYLEIFFQDVAPYYPCINEMDFRMGSQRMLSAPAIQTEDVSLLALNYIILACSDIATAIDTPDSTSNSKTPGWQWFRAADELVGKRKMSGQSDMSLIQFLTLEAVYLTHADKANAAYSIIGIASRLCFQAGLHQQSSWRIYTPFDIHMRQRIFWTVYFLDRHISLSCGRPYSIREADIEIEQPAYLCDKDIHPDEPLPDADAFRSSNVYLYCMVCWARFASEAWDSHFAASVAQSLTSANALVLDTRIKDWTDIVLPSIPLLPPEYPPEARQMRQYSAVYNSFSQLRLLLFRKTMLSLEYDSDIGRTCGDIALTIVQRAEVHSEDARMPTSFRFYLSASLASAMLVLGTLVTRELAAIGLNDRWSEYMQGYRGATSMLATLASSLAHARRVQKDFADLDPVLNEMDVFHTQHLLPTNIKDIFPYTSLDFARQAGPASAVGEREGIAKGEEASAPTPTLATDLWSEVCKGGEGKYGVPWI